jgi:hypothetical protein
MGVSDRIEYMKKLRNLKHIFAIFLLSLIFVFGSIMLFSRDFSSSLNGFFVYRTTGGAWQDYFHTHDLRPSSDIAIIAIDDHTINTLQSTSDQKMLTIPKSIYRDLVEKLEWAWVRGIAFDIVFQNPDPEEATFVTTLQRYPNIVIGTSIERKNGTTNCVTDPTTGAMNCEWFPRNNYTAVSWGFIDTSSFFSLESWELQESMSSEIGNQGVYRRSVKISTLIILENDTSHPHEHGNII